MIKLNLTHEIHAGADAFWAAFFDRAFNDQFYLGALGFPSFAVTEQRETDREIVRVCTAEPKMTLPAPIAKLFGTSLRYTEAGRFDKATQVWRWTMTPGTLADKIKSEGELRVEPAGEGRVRQRVSITFEAKVFGVGGMIESSTEKQLRDAWDASPRFMNEVWFARR